MITMADIDVMDKKKFSMLVEKRAAQTKASYMDSVIDVCEQNNIEVETVGRFVTPSLKAKIEAEAIELNFMKGGNTLPI